jgi:hypothetical protein
MRGGDAGVLVEPGPPSAVAGTSRLRIVAGRAAQAARHRHRERRDDGDAQSGELGIHLADGVVIAEGSDGDGGAGEHQGRRGDWLQRTRLVEARDGW